MLRVTYQDSQALDAELYNIFWSQFDQLYKFTQNRDEWKLLLETLVFLFTTKYNKSLRSFTTYGSQLSNLSFQSSKARLYFGTILGFYLGKKISHYFFNNNNFNINDKWFKSYKRMLIVYKLLDFGNSVRFISSFSGGNDDKIFISILHRILNLKPISITRGRPTFIDNLVNSGIEYQNRQLLWNTILEFLNLTIIPNMITIFNKNDLAGNHLYSNKIASDDQCALCYEYPINPYKITCCGHVYCYLCLIKAIESKKCYHCHIKSQLLKGKPYFQECVQE